VLEEIPAGTHETGLVRIGRQEWRAESRDGTPVPAGSRAKVIEVVGTRLVVWPTDELPPASPSEHEPPTNESDVP
jgi:membrane protein implicated in regulation of membrane protease activity